MKRMSAGLLGLLMYTLTGWSQTAMTPPCMPFNVAIPLLQKDTTLTIEGCYIYKIAVEQDAILTFPDGITAYLNDTTQPVSNIPVRVTMNGNINLLKIRKGDNIYLLIPNYNYYYTFTLQYLTDFSEKGASFEDAVRLFNGETNISSGTQRSKWCKYIFPEQGTVIISSTASAIYAYKGKPKYNDIDQLKQMAIDSQLLALRLVSKDKIQKSPLQISGNKGDVIFIRIFDAQPDPNYPPYTDPLWKVWVNFQKSKKVIGYARNNPFVLSPNENKEYPLLVPVFDSRYSVFRVDNPTGTAVKYKLTTNAKAFTIVDNKQAWDNRMPGQPYIFSVKANSSYTFIMAVDTAGSPLSVRVNIATASVSDKISDYAQSIVATNFGTQTKTDFKLQPDNSYRFKAPDDGLLQIEYPYRSLPYVMFYRDSNRTVEYRNRNFPNALLLDSNALVYMAPDRHFADTVSWKPVFIPGTSFVFTEFYYLSPSGDNVKTYFNFLNDTLFKITLPKNYNGNVLVKYNLIPGAINSLDPYPAFEPSFTLSNDTTICWLTYHGKKKKYYFIYNRLNTTRSGTQVVSLSVSGQKSVTIDNSKKEIHAYVEAQYNYVFDIKVTPGAYIPYYNNTLTIWDPKDTSTTLTIVDEVGDTGKYKLELHIDSTGFDCNHAIQATNGKNNFSKTIFPAYFKYTASADKAILIQLDNPQNYLTVEVDSSDCNYMAWLYGQGKVIFKGKKGTTYQIEFMQPIPSFTISEVPYLKGNDILAVDVNLKHIIDRPNRTVWLQADNTWAGNIYNPLISDGAEMYPPLVENSFYIDGLPDSVRITAMNGDTAWWYFRAMPVKKQPAFVSYLLPNQIAPSQIDTTTQIITCFVADTTPDSVKVIPVYELADPRQTSVYNVSNPYMLHYSGYSVDTLVFLNDTATLTYRVTMNNADTIWKVKAIRTKGSQLIAFNLEGQVTAPVINHQLKQVSALLYPYVDIKKVPTYFTVAQGSTVKAGNTPLANGGEVNYAAVSTLKVVKGDSTTYALNVKQLPKPCSAKFGYTISNDTVYLQALNQKEEWVYFWDFGDKTSATVGYSTYHVYKPGVFTASLTVYDPSSECIDTHVEKFEIGNVAPCKAMFDYSVNVTTRQVTLTNLSKGGTYFWSFDDGSFSTEATPVKTYLRNGVYKITLIATNTTGTCKDIFTKTVTIGDSCDASFSYLVDTTTQTIKLYANLDYPGLQHAWITGDAQLLWGATPEINLNRMGIYTITHTVVDNTNLCTDRVKMSIEVGTTSGDVEADFTTMPDNSAIKFINLSKGNPVKYVWNFGDGTLSSAASPTHTFNTQGVFNVCLTATSSKGISNTKCKKILSQPMATNNCVADFHYYIRPDSLKAICLDRSLGSVSQYMWDFGDGNTSTQPSVIYQYNTPDYYLVTHQVGNEQGCSDRIVRLLNVGKPSAIKCRFLAEQNLLATKAGGYPVDFIGAGLGDDVRIKWTFGDGAMDTTTISPTHVYSSPGTYTVCLTVTDPITEQQDVYCQQVTVVGDNIRHIGNDEIWSIYPVPFDNYFDIQLNNPSNGLVSIELFDISGRKIAVVAHQTLKAGWNRVHFDASQLKTGTYLLRLTHAQGREMQLIIKR